MTTTIDLDEFEGPTVFKDMLRTALRHLRRRPASPCTCPSSVAPEGCEPSAQHAATCPCRNQETQP